MFDQNTHKFKIRELHVVVFNFFGWMDFHAPQTSFFLVQDECTFKICFSNEFQCTRYWFIVNMVNADSFQRKQHFITTLKVLTEIPKYSSFVDSRPNMIMCFP